MADVLVGQARAAFQNSDFQRGESFLLRAQRPELAVKYYREAGMWPDVLRIAKEYMPHKLEDLQDEYEAEQAKSGGRKDLVTTAKMYESSGELSRRIAYFHR